MNKLIDAVKTFLSGVEYMEQEENANYVVTKEDKKLLQEAIDTVVSHCQKPLPTDEEIVNEANEIGEKEYWPIGRQTGFVFGAKWMRDLIQERSKK